jgi:hypothetical protein
MTKVSAPLVGMHFRPPAKAILQHLPADCPLQVVPEPDNAHDEHALQVFVKSADIPASQHEDLASAAQLFGHSIEDILAQEQWHLGYVKATEALHLQPRIMQLAADTNTDEICVPATLTFGASGKPLVTMELP